LFQSLSIFLAPFLVYRKFRIFALCMPNP